MSTDDTVVPIIPSIPKPPPLAPPPQLLLPEPGGEDGEDTWGEAPAGGELVLPPVADPEHPRPAEVLATTMAVLAALGVTAARRLWQQSKDRPGRRGDGRDTTARGTSVLTRSQMPPAHRGGSARGGGLLGGSGGGRTAASRTTTGGSTAPRTARQAPGGHDGSDRSPRRRRDDDSAPPARRKRRRGVSDAEALAVNRAGRRLARRAARLAGRAGRVTGRAAGRSAVATGRATGRAAGRAVGFGRSAGRMAGRGAVASGRVVGRATGRAGKAGWRAWSRVRERRREAWRRRRARRQKQQWQETTADTGPDSRTATPPPGGDTRTPPPPPPPGGGSRGWSRMRPPPGADRIWVGAERIYPDRPAPRTPRAPSYTARRPLLPGPDPDAGSDPVTKGTLMPMPTVSVPQYDDPELTIYDLLEADQDAAEEIDAGALEAIDTAIACERLVTRLETLIAKATELEVPGHLIENLQMMIDQAQTVRAHAMALANRLPAAAEAVRAAADAAEAHKPTADITRDHGHNRPAKAEYHDD